MKIIVPYLTIISLLLFGLACNGEDAQGPETCSVGSYSEGCEILDDELMMEFEYCYPSDISGDPFSFASHSGKVFMLERSAAWWAPCFDLIPEGEDIYEYWKDDNRVEIIHFLDDYGSGNYSCTQWGNAGSDGIPPLIDDGINNAVFNWFENQNDAGLGSLVVFIDYTMKIVNIRDSSPSFTMAKIIIEDMLNDFPPLSNDNSSGVINQFNLTRLYPNPFIPVLNIDFDINQAGWVKVNIADITGSMVKTVYEGYGGIGKHHLSWDSDKLQSGTYFVTLELENSSLTRKVVLLK